MTEGKEEKINDNPKKKERYTFDERDNLVLKNEEKK